MKIMCLRKKSIPTCPTGIGLGQAISILFHKRDLGKCDLCNRSRGMAQGSGQIQMACSKRVTGEFVRVFVFIKVGRTKKEW